MEHPLRVVANANVLSWLLCSSFQDNWTGKRPAVEVGSSARVYEYGISAVAPRSVPNAIYVMAYIAFKKRLPFTTHNSNYIHSKIYFKERKTTESVQPAQCSGCRTSETRHIGEGACGSVWAALIGSKNTCAIKREDGGKWRSIYNDFVMHRKLLQTLSASQSRVQIPTCYEYIKADNFAWWDERNTLFPTKQQERCNVLITERIPPFPQCV